MEKLATFLAVFLIVREFDIVLAKKSGAEQYCHLRVGQARLTGICKQIKDCPSAISNYRSGIHPTLCPEQKQPNGAPYVCCPAERRISEQKCEEYMKEEVETLGKSPTARNIKSPRAIIKGTDATRDEYPYMVALGYGNFSDQIWGCGGALISEDYILTTAHCIGNSRIGSPKRIIIGDNHLVPHEPFPKKRLAAITKIIVHPEYKHPLKYNDIALLQLRSKVKFSKSIRPICLPSPRIRLEREPTGTITGWGQTEYGGNTANHLQEAVINRFNQSSCRKFYGNKPREQNYSYPKGILNAQFCAGDNEKDSCLGDSGGPFMVQGSDTRKYLVGIVSFGSRYCGDGYPGVYTNVQSYLDWIESIVWTDESLPDDYF